MRRCYSVSKGGGSENNLPIPFVEDCVFYAPLKNGDLKDYISGVEPTTDDGCDYVWDENKNMYLFRAIGKTNQTCEAVLKYEGLSMDYSSGARTYVIDVDENTSYFTSSYTNRYNIMFTSPIRTPSHTMVEYICHYRYDTSYNPMKGLHRYILVANSGTWKLYKDGVLKNTMSSTATSPGTSVAICQLNTNNSRNYLYAKNAIIYNRALSDSEIMQLCQPYYKPENPIFDVPLQQNNVTDLVSEVVGIRGNGQFSWDTAENAYMIKTTTGGQKCITFTIPNRFNLSESNYNYTIYADIYVKVFSGTCDFLQLGSGTSDKSNAVSLGETHRWTGFTTNDWHKLAMTKSGTTVKFYMDGILVKTDTTSTFASLNAASWSNWNCTSTISIGGGFNSYNYTAYIRNVLIYDRVLTQTEIQSIL